ncbi:MAG: hypothetical protein RMJ52_13315 [Gemmataceae bacterium]|nr:hypothetical protein [Gemmataceae bacterium]
MGKWKICLIVVLGLATLVCAGTPKELQPTNTWQGSVEDWELAKKVPKVITNARDFDKLIKTWNVRAKVKDVNFEKELVLVAITQGSQMSVTARLNDHGELTLSVLTTDDLAPGFRYVVISVPREGVKSVNGKELPK